MELNSPMSIQHPSFNKPRPRLFQATPIRQRSRFEELRMEHALSLFPIPASQIDKRPPSSCRKPKSHARLVFPPQEVIIPIKSLRFLFDQVHYSCIYRAGIPVFPLRRSPKACENFQTMEYALAIYSHIGLSFVIVTVMYTCRRLCCCVGRHLSYLRLLPLPPREKRCATPLTAGRQRLSRRSLSRRFRCWDRRHGRPCLLFLSPGNRKPR